MKYCNSLFHAATFVQISFVQLLSQPPGLVNILIYCCHISKYIQSIAHQSQSKQTSFVLPQWVLEQREWSTSQGSDLIFFPLSNQVKSIYTFLKRFNQFWQI